MRASEALLKGSKMIRWVMGTQNDLSGGGCALGMMARVHGLERLNFCDDPLFTSVEEYQWMHTASPPLACNCLGSVLLGSGGDFNPRELLESRVAYQLVHLFNYHVMTEKDWTIEQLSKWLDIVDPSPLEKVVVEETQEQEELVAV